MRRVLASAAVLVVLTGTVVTGAGPASSVSKNSLLIVAKSRDGKSVPAPAQVYSLTTGRTYWLHAGRLRHLPSATYLVLIKIRSGGDVTYGAKQVQVSGSTVTTFRAREGRPIEVRLRPRPPTGYGQQLHMAICVRHGGGLLYGDAAPGALYVIPSKVSAVAMDYSSTWTPPGDGAGPRYLGGATHTHGLPSGVSRTFRRSELAEVRLVARRGPVTGAGLVDLEGRRDVCPVRGVFDVDVTGTLPTSFTAYVSPGRWGADEEISDGMISRTHGYRAGHSYHLTLNRAAWGPRKYLPYTVGDGRLYVGATEMITDPDDEFDGPRSFTKYRVTHRGKTIMSRRVHFDGISPTPKLPGPGWYTLHIAGIRPQSRLFKGAFSPRAALQLHFHTDLAQFRQVRGYITAFAPAGLDDRNRAAPGSHTVVSLNLRRDKPTDESIKQLHDTVQTVRAWASFDHEHSWHALRVRRHDGRWTTVVHNPASGAISVRAAVTDTHGDSSRTTVTDAYGVR